MRQRSLAWLCVVGCVWSGPALAQSFSNTFFFGDSNSDSGRYFYLSQSKTNPALTATYGAYTTNPGPEWSVALGSLFGITVTPTSAPGGGNNYAAGGARVVFENPTSNAWSTQSQIAAYLASTGGRADPNALYVYWIGVNDLKPGTTGGPGNIVNPPNFPALTTLGLQAASQVTTLSAAGARFIVVPNTISIASPDAGVASGYGYNANTVQSRAFYDQVVWGQLGAQGTPFIPADINTVYNYVLLNPAQFGITVTNVNTPACGPTTGAPNCGPPNYVTPNADRTYFYADGPSSSTGGGHVTTAVQLIEADYVYSLIVAPSQISFLAEVPLKTRAAVIQMITNQIPLSFGQAGAFHGWASGDLSWLKITNSANGFPDDPGTPVSTTAGFDFRIARDWLVGAAFSLGHTDQTFSLGGGFKQDEFAVSVYTAFRRDPFWFNAIASWGTLRDDANRQVPIGLTVQPNTGNTNGTNLSLAFETGYNFVTRFGAPVVSGSLPVKALPVAPYVLTHGPVAGVVLQEVRIDGYTEFNPSNITALAFGAQRRDSAVTAFGYQVNVDLGAWQPYAKAVWNHEWADLDREVTASLTTIVAPSYSMPAVRLGRDWGTGTVGARFKVADNVNGYVAAIGQVGENHVTDYGVQVGLNVAFDWRPVVAKY